MKRKPLDSLHPALYGLVTVSYVHTFYSIGLESIYYPSHLHVQ